MSVEQDNVIDAISLSNSSNVVLTISDHLEWSQENEEIHLELLQNKLNTYLVFFESGELYESYPAAEGKKVTISIVAKFDLNEKAKGFYAQVEAILAGAGLGLEFQVLKAPPNR
ncbi:DUF6572 domain-containing protein [Chitinimonas arctica]|uniref:DUF6572 domain-containing protein n=1 Tax=Chitinimonas arctica TaxID=2594795 RepID=UPI0015D17FA4|nr:DUF6572 domain-containing protein [Chitinimonas arctica]